MSPLEASQYVVDCYEVGSSSGSSSGGSDLRNSTTSSVPSNSQGGNQGGYQANPAFVEGAGVVHSLFTVGDVRKGGLSKVPGDEKGVVMLNTQGAHHPPVPVLKGFAEDLRTRYTEATVLLFPVHKDNVVLRNSLKDTAITVVCLESKNNIVEYLGDVAPPVREMIDSIKEPVRTHRAKLKSIPGATPPGGSFASGARVHIASKRIASGKKQGGAGMVHTPWYPDGVGCEQVSLDSEVVDFYKFMALTPVEVSAKMELRTSLQSLLSTVLPNTTVKLTGSFAYGTMMPSSMLDLVIEATDLSELPRVIDVLKCRGLSPVQDNTDAVSLSFPDGKARLVLDARPASPLRKAATVLNKCLSEHPEAKPIICLLRHVLGQCRYLGEAGLNGYVIAVMTVACVKEIKNSDGDVSQGGYLLRTLKMLTKSFDPAVMAVDLNGGLVPKTHSEPLAVLDPLDPTVNIAKSCTNFTHISIQLAYIHTTLEGWRTKLASKKNYKGRTPLSSIMSHIPLWPRQKELQCKAKERDTMRVS